MKPTLKSINQNLPRFDALRREYRTSDQYGICPARTFAGAYADLDASGNVSGITIYAVGDAYERRHYYAGHHYDGEGEDVAVISDQIEAAIRGEGLDECGRDSKRFRDMIVREIRQAIIEGGNHNEG